MKHEVHFKASFIVGSDERPTYADLLQMGQILLGRTPTALVIGGRYFIFQAESESLTNEDEGEVNLKAIDRDIAAEYLSVNVAFLAAANMDFHKTHAFGWVITTV